jgi:DNA polymerase I-like protein with 3'-5' exonuclease and polymerase domains
MIQEIVDGIDMHTNNAINLFGDPKFRQEAKIISFRFLYCGSAYGFHLDYRMPRLGLKRWQAIEDEFYDKYRGLGKWQNANYREVCSTGMLKSFTGREYVFLKYQDKDGAWGYSKPQVGNYIVQGTATADIMPLCMIVIFRRLKAAGYFETPNLVGTGAPKRAGVKFINQVHDSIILDMPERLIEEVATICIEVFREIPKLVYNYWGYNWITPMNGEAKAGINWAEMIRLKI